jgi:hypothetical protein
MTSVVPVHGLARYVTNLRHELGIASPIAPGDVVAAADPATPVDDGAAAGAGAGVGAVGVDATVGVIQCSMCAATFPDYIAQRAHCRSKWHVDNLKRTSAGLAPWTADDMDVRAGDGESSSGDDDGSHRYRSFLSCMRSLAPSFLSP